MQIVDALTEHSVWSERFDRDVVDIFDLQDEITEMVAARLEAELGLTEQQIDPEFAAAYSRLAYAIVLGMVDFDEQPDNERLDAALRAAKRAIELDDQDANGYFTLGRVHLARREYIQAINAPEYVIELNPCLA